MCGIAGIIAHDQVTDAERRCLGEMLSRLSHRGPDDEHRHDEPAAALGHRRLSIIDLSGGRQPQSNEDGSIWSIVNGEFYNFRSLRERLIASGHRFRSTSDSECLPHLYEEHGGQCIERLHGMFGLALWDARRRTALLARDRLGVKPLYYHVDERRLVFGSELKAVLAAPGVPTTLDATALHDYMTFGYIPSPKTIYQGVRKLPPGMMLVYREGRAELRRYWDLSWTGWNDAPLDDVAEQLSEALFRATDDRLVADVPLGAFLSGGLDSSSIVAAMTASADGEPVTTVTCGFDERDCDERDDARAIAERFDTRHVEHVVQADAATILDTLAWHFDEPFADPSAIPMYLMSGVARRHFTVGLSGDGGDELMAGYRRYRFDRNEQRIRRLLPPGLRRPIFSALAACAPGRPWIPRPLRAASTLRNLAAGPADAHGLSVATLHPAEAQALLHPDLATSIRDYDPLDAVRTAYAACDAPDHVSKCQYADIRLGLGDGILTKVDRASMAHGLEVRSPMLDHRFAEFAWSIPPRLRIRRGRGKYVLRHAMRQRIGNAAADRAKSGFDVPLDAWFRGPLGERFEREVLAYGAGCEGWIQPDAVSALWQAHRRGTVNAGPTLWKVTMLAAWGRRFRSGDVATTESRTSGRPECIPAS